MHLTTEESLTLDNRLRCKLRNCCSLLNILVLSPSQLNFFSLSRMSVVDFVSNEKSLSAEDITTQNLKVCISYDLKYEIRVKALIS